VEKKIDIRGIIGKSMCRLAVKDKVTRPELVVESDSLEWKTLENVIL
jgi:hypothetical protein